MIKLLSQFDNYKNRASLSTPTCGACGCCCCCCAISTITYSVVTSGMLLAYDNKKGKKIKEPIYIKYSYLIPNLYILLISSIFLIYFYSNEKYFRNFVDSDGFGSLIFFIPICALITLIMLLVNKKISKFDIFMVILFMVIGFISEFFLSI